MKHKSEFGKGLVICLVKFAEHFMILESRIREQKKMKEKCEDKTLFSEGNAVHMWFNGASDHLYEIEVPEGKEWNSIRRKVKKLQQEGLEYGHGDYSGFKEATITSLDKNDEKYAWINYKGRNRQKVLIRNLININKDTLKKIAKIEKLKEEIRNFGIPRKEEIEVLFNEINTFSINADKVRGTKDGK